MPVDLREIASISGMSGLVRIMKPTRNGVIVETLEEKPKSIIAQARHRISLLHEISMYTTDSEETVPLAEVFDRIHKKYKGDLPVTAKSPAAALNSFMEEIMPEYDRERVYQSDIKKLVSWYEIVSKHLPFTEAEQEEPAAEVETEAKPKAKSKKAEPVAETTAATEEAAAPKSKKTKKSAE